jgi:hypothetical protein
MKFTISGSKASYYKGLLLVLFILSGKGVGNTPFMFMKSTTGLSQHMGL